MGLPPESNSIRFCGLNRATTLMLFAEDDMMEVFSETASLPWGVTVASLRG
jgi:hypothetical protein